jgi:hypothetical protein
MKLVSTIPHVGGLSEILVFYCSRCKQAKTKVQDKTVRVVGCRPLPAPALPRAAKQQPRRRAER